MTTEGERQLRIDEHQRAAINRAMAFLHDKPTEPGSREYGYYELYNFETDELYIRAGDEAGRGSNQEFQYSVPKATHKFEVLIWAHTHPSVSGRDSAARALNRANRRPSTVDNRNLRPYGPLVIKGPDGKIRVYPRRNPKPFSQLQ